MSVAELLASIAEQGVELWAEGPRLRFRGSRGALSPEGRAALSAQGIEVVRALRAQAAGSMRIAPVSHNQRALWFIAQEAPETAAYNVAISRRVLSPVDPAAMRDALQALVDRHATLRTTYALSEDGQLVQRTVGTVDVDFAVHDLPHASESELRAHVDADYRRPFDLERGPVFRATLITRSPSDHVFLMAVHHIAADGWSLRILLEDFDALLREALGQPAVLPPRTDREYVDFAAWQERMLAGPEGARLAERWDRWLQPPRAQLELLGDRSRPPRKSFRGSTLSLTVDRELTAALHRIAREQGATLFVLMLAAFDAMLFRLTGTEDVVVGTPTFERTQAEFARVVGHFVNPIPIRTSVNAGMSFRELLASVRQTVHEALDAQDYPLTLMVQRAHPTRDASRSPLFETFFGLLSIDQLLGASAPVDGVLRYEAYPIDQMDGQFDLWLNVTEGEGTLELSFRYSTDIFDEATVRGFGEHYAAILEGVTANVDAALDALPAARAARVTAGPTDEESIEAFLAALAARDVRLSLDGERLKVNAPAGALDDASKATLLRRKTEVIASLSAERPPAGGMRRVPRDGPLPISFAQQRLWFLDRMQPGSSHYNIAVPLRFTGHLHVESLRTAIEQVTQRHESLRLRVREEDGNPRAEIAADAAAALTLVDLASLPEPERTEELRRVLAAQAEAPFDLAHGPMARFVLVRLAADEHALLIAMHHIAADGWSLSVVTREIAVLYDAVVGGKPSPLPPLAVQYVDYAAWQREQLNAGLLVRQLRYWQSELQGAPAVIELPTDRPRPAMQSFRGRRFVRTMSPELLEAIRAASRARGATLFMTLLAAWQVLLARYSGQDDVVVGSPMANRDRPELEPLIGLFVNNVVLRGRLEGNPTFAEFLERTRATVLRAFDNRELPFDRLVEGVRPERSTSHGPLFQTLLTLHSFPITPMRPSGLTVEQMELGEEALQSSRYDVALEIDEQDGSLRMRYEFATDLFDQSTIERLHASYLTLLGNLVADVTQPVRDVPMLAPDALDALLDAVNDTGLDHDRSQRIEELVRLTVERTPDAVAVVAEDATLTYAELERRSGQLANLLVARGVRRGALVGVCLDRTSSLPIALLAVLKAGAAYVPLDPGHPAERLAYTLTDARVACVVTETRFVEAVRAADVPLVLLDADAEAIASERADLPAVGGEASDLAYVIYTSGSTGRPKGVEIEHRNLVNFLRAMQREPGIREDDVLLAVTTPSFDIAGLELFLPLVVGARTVIASRADVLDGERLVSLANGCGATILQATPATWRLMIDAGWEGRTGLTALCGGEALPRDLARELLLRVDALWNMYGPTETTVWSTVHQVRDAERDIPIGHPVANTTVYVLDAAGRPAPIGVAGELCIGGEGVARGYRERPELSAEKFVTVSLGGRAPERIYRTGDVVRLRGDLSLEFVGRRDHQVKVRGYRIELGEIESVLSEHPDVRRCVVIVREDAPGDVRLVAYVVSAGADAPPAEALRALLRSRLPDYMVPSAIIALPELPLTPNGKIDRKALPAPAASRDAGASAPEAVMSEPQRRVAAIWRDVLRLERVGLNENFFDLGGHSLLVVKVHAALRREFGADLTVVDLFQRTTVASQADLLADTTSRDAGLHRAQARLARQALV